MNNVLVSVLVLLTALAPLVLRGTVNLALPPLLAALLALLLVPIPFAEFEAILRIAWSAGAIVISLGVMAAALDGSGFFRWAAFNLASRARGSGGALFWQVVLLGFLSTLLLTNEASILLVAPLVVEVTRWVGMKPSVAEAYVRAGAIVSLATGVATGTSSLSSLVAMELSGVSPVLYLRMLFVPGVVGVLVCATLLYLVPCFSAMPPSSAPVPSQVHPPKRSKVGLGPPPGPALVVPLFRDPYLAWVTVAVVVLAHVMMPLVELAGAPGYTAPVAGAVLVVAVAAGRGALNLRALLTAAPWPVFGFAGGMLLLGRALHHMGLGAWIAGGLFLEQVLPVRLGLALASVASMITAVLALTLTNPSMQGAPVTGDFALIFAPTVLGIGFGAILNPAGSLAAVLWFHDMERRNMPVSRQSYLCTTLLVVPLGLAVALLSLPLWLRLIGK